MPPISYTKTATGDGAWDAGANEKKLGSNEDDLRAAFAWVDDSMDATTKSAYRFVHHFVGDDGAPGAASTVACSAGIGVLNGGRSGTTIPEADKAGVHAHLAHHLEDAGKDAPELKSAPRYLWTSRAWDSTESPPHPHDDMSHEHSHSMRDGDGNVSTLTHTHSHHHDDGSVGHESDAHDHEGRSDVEVPGQVGVFGDAFGQKSARRPSTRSTRSTRSRRAWGTTEMPPHPHDDASHEHSHRMDDGATLTHDHPHHHDDGSVGHETDAHDHRDVTNFPTPLEGPGDGRGRRRARGGAAIVGHGSSRVDAGARSERVERTITSQVELRATSTGAPKIVGYAAVFDTYAEIEDWFDSFMETCVRGCFSKTLADGADVRALFNHDPNFVIGRTKSGTLTCGEDSKGLHYEATPPDTQWARDLCVTLDRGDVDQSSFGFRVIRDRWSAMPDPDPDDDGDTDTVDCRQLMEVQLYDVSPVAFPAYSETESSLRSLIAADGISYEDYLRVSVRVLRGLPISSTRDREVARYVTDRFARFGRSAPAPARTSHPVTPSTTPTRSSRSEPTRTGHSMSDYRARLDALRPR